MLEYDGELVMEQLTPRFWEQLQSLQPFGMGNPEPVFVARGVSLLGEPKVMREKHIKLKLRRYVSSAAGQAATKAPPPPRAGRSRAAWMRWAGGWPIVCRMSRSPAALPWT